MDTRIDLLRHAQSRMNLDRGLVGGRSNHTPLSAQGRRCAHELGLFYAGQGWSPDAVYCTSAVRSRQTAELLARSAGWPAPVVEDGLLELSQGSAEGQPRDLWWTPDEIAAMEEDPLNHRLAPDAESHAEVQRRMIATVRSLARRHPGGHVVAVGHGIAMRTLLWALTGGSHREGFREVALDNLGRISLRVTPDASIEVLAHVPQPDGQGAQG